MAEGEANAGGCLGCLSTILFFMLVWALIFGVTIGGVHYGISCSTDSGVSIESTGEPSSTSQRATEPAKAGEDEA